MVRKVVTVDEGLHLPTAVQTQLKADLDAEFADYVTDAQTAASGASLSVVAAESARDEAGVARDEAVAAAASASAPTDTMVASLFSNAASSTRTVTDTLYAPLSVVQGLGEISLWGVLSTNPADATANSDIIDLALSESRVVRLPPGKFHIARTIELYGPQKLIGSGSNATILTSTNATLTSVKFTGGPDCAVLGMTITKEVQPTSDVGYGIDFGITSGGAMLSDLRIRKHGIGIRLGGCSLGNLTNTVVEWNYSHGVLITNQVSSYNPLQWYLLNVLSQGNGGDGFRVVSAVGKGSCAFGKLVQCYTYANVGRGVIVAAPSAADGIAAVRISDCFFGGDGNDELYLDTYGGTHQITNTYFELCGTDPTGPGIFAEAAWSTGPVAKSNIGYGMVVSANTTAGLVSGCYFVQNSYSGVSSAGNQMLFSGNHFDSNGLATAPAKRIGLDIQNGTANVIGNISGNIAGSTSQAYGFNFAVNTVIYNGNLTIGNAVAPRTGVAPATIGTNRET